MWFRSIFGRKARVDAPPPLFDEALLRRLDRVEAHERAGLIARSCLDDVARAVADALPGVSVEVQGASESLYVSWD